MGMVLEFEAYGVTQVNRELVRFSEAAQDPTEAWAKIIDEMKDDISEQFSTEGKSMSGGWAPLKPVTIATKSRLGQLPEIMRATDRLKDSLTDAAGSDQVMKVEKEGFEFYSTVPYGKYHMGPAKDGSRPARKPIDFTEMQKRKYVKTLQEELLGGRK